MALTKLTQDLLAFTDSTGFLKLPVGTTAERPGSPATGYIRFNTTNSTLEGFDGTNWKDIPAAPPGIDGLAYPGSQTAADPAGGETITLTGTNFKSGFTVTVGGTSAPSSNLVSPTSATFVTPAKAGGDYNVVFTNANGEIAQLVNGITYSGLPAFTSPAASPTVMGTAQQGAAITPVTIAATDGAEQVDNFTVTTGSLPSGLTLNQSTGVLSGTLSLSATVGNTDFTVTATDDEGQTSTRQFRYAVTTAPCTIKFLVVAGGGGGGSYNAGGGGAGGVRTSFSNATNPISGGGCAPETILTNPANGGTEYAIVGDGGGVTYGSAQGPQNGGDSQLQLTQVGTTITSTGGGAPATRSGSWSPTSGGSGGGGSSYSTTAGAAGTSCQGYAGGDGFNGIYYAGGGGGGAGGIGGNYNNRFGGPGIICNILNATNAATAGVGEVIGTDVWYGGGGGASGNSGGNGNAGGNGGGGNSASNPNIDDAQNGTDGTGGGGGSSTLGWNAQPTYGIGGSGVVIMRYPSSYTCNVTSGTQATGSPFTEGSEKITVFKAVGNYQFNFTS